MSLRSKLEAGFKHFEELRSRIIKSVGVFLLCFCVCYNSAGRFIGYIVKPAGHLIFTAPGEAFSAYISIATLMAAVVSSPFTFYQIWAFIGVALKPAEKRFVFIFAPLSLFFFLSGCAFAFWVAVPMAYKFLMSFSSEYLVPMVTVKNYLGFLGNMVLAFGVAFELPLILAFFAAIGLATPQFLRSKRRHAIIIILIVAALLTPPDICSQLMLAIPLMFLYEIGILMVQWATNYRNRG